MYFDDPDPELVNGLEKWESTRQSLLATTGTIPRRFGTEPEHHRVFLPTSAGPVFFIRLYTANRFRNDRFSFHENETPVFGCGDENKAASAISLRTLRSCNGHTRTRVLSAIFDEGIQRVDWAEGLARRSVRVVTRRKKKKEVILHRVAKLVTNYRFATIIVT